MTTVMMVKVIIWIIIGFVLMTMYLRHEYVTHYDRKRNSFLADYFSGPWAFMTLLMGALFISVWPIITIIYCIVKFLKAWVRWIVR